MTEKWGEQYQSPVEHEMSQFQAVMQFSNFFSSKGNESMWREQRRITEWFSKNFFLARTFFFFILACTTYRKIPGINTYTAEQPEKEQEVIPTVTSIDVPNPGGEKSTSLECADTQPDSKHRGIIFAPSLSVIPHIIVIGQKRHSVLMSLINATERSKQWEESA